MSREIEDSDAIASALISAGETNSQIEVMYTAMLYLKQNPNSTIQEAVNIGLEEWVEGQ